MSIRSLPTLSGAAVLLTASLTTHAQAQCWSIASLDAPAGVTGSDHWIETCTLWDPDGIGPQSRRLVAAGYFTAIGGVHALNIAQWDGARWSRLGSSGLENAVIFDLHPLPDGTLLAAGEFSRPPRNIARLVGNTWTAVGLGVSSSVYDLLPMPDGSVLLTGAFTTANGLPAGRLARFDPATNSLAPFPSSNAVASGRVLTAALSRDGSIFIGGSFSSVGGVSASRVARWDGTTWSSLGSGISSGEVYDLMVDHDGTLYAGGLFTAAGGAASLNIATWNGSSWSPLSTPGLQGVNNAVYSLLPDPAGGILVAGNFTQAGDQPIARLARWNNGWSDPGARLDGEPSMLVDLDGTIAVTGSFPRAGGYPANGLAFRDEQGQWLPTTTTPYTGVIQALATLPDGRIVAAAPYFARESFGTSQLLLRDNGVWQPLSHPYNEVVRALLPMPDGSIVVAGRLRNGGGLPLSNIARWIPGPDLGSWQSLGTGTSGTVIALARYNNDIIAAGAFSSAGGVPASNIARFDGTAWSPLASGTDGYVTALLVTSDNNLVVAGDFHTAGGIATRGAAMWDGSTWSPMSFGDSTPNIAAIAESPTLGLFVARNQSNEALCRWNGTTWQRVSLETRGSISTNASGRALAVLPDGDVVFGGSFTAIDGVHTQSLARWNGRSFSSLNPAFFPSLDAIKYLAVTPSGDVAVAGTVPEQTFWTITPGDAANPPIITLQPDDILSCSDSHVTLTMAAEYTGPLSYYWFDANTQYWRILLGTGPTLTIENSTSPRAIIGVASGAPCDGSARTRTISILGVQPDTNSDGFLDFFDYLRYIELLETDDLQADVNRDGFLDFFDYDLFLQFFESGC